jgi:hypothetical protein
MWHGKKEGFISGSIYKLRLPADKNIETITDNKKYNFIRNVFRLFR